jgi:putative transposase
MTTSQHQICSLYVLVLVQSQVLVRLLPKTECLNEEIFDSLDDARRRLGLWRYDYNHVRPHSSLGNKTPAEARRALELSEGSAHGVLAQAQNDNYQPQGLSL